MLNGPASQLSVTAKGASGGQSIYIVSFNCIVIVAIDCDFLINMFDGIRCAWIDCFGPQRDGCYHNNMRALRKMVFGVKGLG